MILFWSRSEQGAGLSNFAPVRIDIRIYNRPFRFKSAEAAYQAHKVGVETIPLFQGMSAYEAKQNIKHYAIRTDWADWKDRAMRRVLDVKFSKPKYRDILLETGDEELVHWAPWDQYWGWSEHRGGENKLGNMLMEIRSLLEKEE